MRIRIPSSVCNIRVMIDIEGPLRYRGTVVQHIAYRGGHIGTMALLVIIYMV
jgi:hypothetical protein